VTEYARPMDVVAAVISNSEGRYLVQQRTKGALAGRWEVPGGKVEDGEGVLNALYREMREELGHGAASLLGVQRKLAEVVHEYEHGLFRVHFFSLLSLGVISEGAEGQPVRWISPTDVGHYDLIGSDGHCIALDAVLRGHLVERKPCS